ncbi:MAG: lysophospholipid acyltransferase family protein [Chthoniobacterales bacterium]|nr:lysophospholipid acyltransferase family protein [Chthoniobacterales bacterium]
MERRRRINNAGGRLKIQGQTARVLIALGYCLLQLWARTLRWKIDDRAALVDQPRGKPFIGATWHNRLLFWAYAARRYLSQYHGSALISASRDGELIADLVQRFGFDVVRGSSSRKGASAIMQLAAVLDGGRIVGVVPDGPRGPAYEIAPGIVFLAQKSGAPILPMNLEFSSCWRLRSWDRFILPRPFSTVHLTLGPFHRIPPTSTDAEFESERLRLQNAMMESLKTR